MKVLVADDDRITRLKLVAILEKWGYEVIACEDGLEAWEIIEQEDSPSLLMLDWMMPGMSGPEICRKVRELGRVPYCFIIMLTSKNEKEDIVKGIEAGADDYVTKPFYPHELKVRLRAGQRIVELNRELFEARNALEEQATHDALTGLWNRPAIMDHLVREMDRNSREKKGQCVCLMDIDKFKLVNDTYGHKVGDQVLIEVARRLETSLRPYDMVGRYGGEEFVIIIAGCACDETKNQVERLRKALADEPFATDAGDIPITASFGIGIMDNKHSASADTLVSVADKSLYKAKANGRNRIEVEYLEEEPEK